MMGYGLGYGYGSGYGMMGGWGGVFVTAACFVWLLVGILAAVWLWQHINKK